MFDPLAPYHLYNCSKSPGCSGSKEATSFLSPGDRSSSSLKTAILRLLPSSLLSVLLCQLIVTPLGVTCSVKLIYSSTFFSTSTNKRSEFKNLKVKRSSFQVQLSKAKIRSKDVHNLEAQAVRVSHHAATTTSTGHSHLRSMPQPSPLIPSPDFFKSGYIPKMFLTCRNILFFRICWTTWPGQGP